MADWMARQHHHRVTFVSVQPGHRAGNFEKIQYEPFKNPPPGEVIPWHQDFERQLGHCHGVYQALKRRRDIRPDLVVGHSGFGSTLLLPEILRCPILNYFEYFLDSRENDMLYRKGFPHPEWYYHWRRANNAMVMLDLHNCQAGYAPTQWQRQLLPPEYHAKVDALFDGIDTDVFRPIPDAPRQVGDVTIPEGVRVVTYVSRGFEAIRGFDMFMKVAKRIYTERPDTIFLVAGRDRVVYGSDAHLFGSQSYKDWVLKQDDYDLSKFHFLGWLDTPDLVRLFSLSDLHIYLTAPFPLSWSLFNALACGATVLASNTPPVRELIVHERNGLLADFFDVDQLAGLALKVLRDPPAYKSLGRTGREIVEAQYSLEVMAPRLLDFFGRQIERGYKLRDAAVAAPGLAPNVIPSTGANSKPLVSIITACYNGGHLIRRALHGLADSTYRNFEHIVVDDCSTDNTVEVLERLQKEFPFRLIKSEVNRKPPTTRNEAIRHAQGKYILPLDQDNFFSRDYIEALVDAAESNGDGYSPFYSHMVWFGLRNRRIKEPEWSLDRMLAVPYIDMGSLFSRKAFDAVGGQDPQCVGLADYELFLSMALHGWTGKLVEGPTFFYNIRAGSHSDFSHRTAFREKRRDSVRYIFKKHETKLRELGHDPELLMARLLEKLGEPPKKPETSNHAGGS